MASRYSTMSNPETGNEVAMKKAFDHIGIITTEPQEGEEQPEEAKA